MIQFTVVGIPKGAPRPRRAKFGGVYVPATAKPFEDAIRLAALPHRPPLPIPGPVRLSIRIRIGRPKTHFKTNRKTKSLELRAEAPTFCCRKPDIDNMLKVIMDTLTNCQFWCDDSQVVIVHIAKVWDEPVGCDIQIHEEND